MPMRSIYTRRNSARWSAGPTGVTFFSTYRAWTKASIGFAPPAGPDGTAGRARGFKDQSSGKSSIDGVTGIFGFEGFWAGACAEVLAPAFFTADFLTGVTTAFFGLSTAYTIKPAVASKTIRILELKRIWIDSNIYANIFMID